MSLINQMLRDLEARRAIEQPVLMPGNVRALPIKPYSMMFKMLVLSVLTVLAFAAGILAQRRLLPTSYTPSVFDLFPAQVASSVAYPADTNPVSAPQPKPSVAVSAPAETAPSLAAAVPLPVVQAHSETTSPEKNLVARVTPAAEAPAEIVKAEAPKNRHQNIHQAAQVIAKKRPATALADSVEPVEPVEPVNSAISVSINKQVRVATVREQADASYRTALNALKQKQTEEALTALRNALLADPSHSSARQTLASLLQQQHADEAQALLQEGLRLNPAQPALAAQLARLQVEHPDLAGAASTLEQHAAAGVSNADYRALHGVVLQRLGQHSRAIEEYQAALQLAPHAGVWWMGLGFSLEAEGKQADARQAFLRARSSGNLSAELDKFMEQKLR